MDAPAANKAIVLRYFFRFRIAEGRIAEVWEYLDTLRQQELGAFA